jgi:hypothetical protein
MYGDDELLPTWKGRLSRLEERQEIYVGQLYWGVLRTDG